MERIKRSFGTKLFIILLLTATALFSKAMIKDVFNLLKEEEKPVFNAALPKSYDPALLKKLQDVCNNMDVSRNECFIRGVINSINEADSTDVITGLNYLYSKRGSDFYYKLGDTETINAKGLYLYIDHANKTIMLSQQKNVTEGVGMVDMKKLLEGVEFEEYDVISRAEGDNEIISLINEEHVSCKEYSVTIDVQSQQVKRVFARLSNTIEPERTDNEKLLDIYLTELSTESSIEKYLSREIVRKVDKQWKVNKGFEEYQLLVL